MKKEKDWLFLLPAVIVVAVMTQIPFLLTLIYSTLKWNLTRPDLGITFNGLKNYTYFLKIDDFSSLPEFYTILGQTIVLTLATLLICSVMGFLFSILLDHSVPGINIARTLIMGPFFCYVHSQRCYLENNHSEYLLRVVWGDIQKSRTQSDRPAQL